MNFKQAKDLARLIELEDPTVECEGFLKEGKNYIICFRDMRNGYTFEVSSKDAWEERKRFSEIYNK